MTSLLDYLLPNRRRAFWTPEWVFGTALAFAAAMPPATASGPLVEPPGTILILGDSLTAGYGLDDPMSLAYPALLQEKIDEAGLNFRVINAGLSGETSAGGLRRVDWVLRQPVDVFILALGGNDGLRGIPPATLRENLQMIFDKVRARNPHARLVLAGMQMPRSMGGYAEDFAAVYPEIARKNEATLIPFLLEGVGGVRSLNLPDGIHPAPEGHVKLAETVWGHLRPLLTASSGGSARAAAR